MKKIILLLMLLLCAWLPAQALAGDEAVYAVVLRENGADTVLGTGVIYLQSDLLLTAEACAVEGELRVQGDGGEYAVAERIPVANSGAVLLRLEKATPAMPVELASYNVAAMSVCYTADAAGHIVPAEVYEAIYSHYRGLEALLLSGEEGILPGAVWLDGRGGLVGMTLTQQGEGQGLYTAFETGLLYGYTLQDIRTNNAAYLPVKTEWADGVLTVSWEDGKRSGGLYLLSVSAAENLYYTTYSARGSERRIEVALPAGRAYDVQVQWARTERTALPPSWLHMKRVNLTGTAFHDYDYQQECYVAIEKKGRHGQSVHAREDFISADMLGEGNTCCLQLLTSYDVAEEVELPLVIELIAPDGQCYFTVTDFLFSPKTEAEDHFCVDISELWADCAAFSEGGVLAAGEYALRYYIAGGLAGETVFPVHEMGAKSPEETALTGFVTDVAMNVENGLVSLDWENAADLPEGDVTYYAFMEVEGNTYNSYVENASGDMTASFFLVPDRTSAFWVVWAREGGDATRTIPDDVSQFQVVRGVERVAPYTANGFTHLRGCFILGEGTGSMFQEEAVITREMIAGDAVISYQTEDTYQVAAESADHPMLFTLYTPEGYVFMDEASYSFLPEYNASDLWAADVSYLFDSYEQLVHQDQWPAGEYVFVCYIDGCEAGRATFTLE